MDKIKNLCKYFPVFILALFALACTNKAKENTALLHSAAQKIHADAKTDEALLLLKTIETGVLNQADYAYYVLVQVRAWDFAGVNITMSDTAVVKSINYFTKTNDAEKAALAYFTLGRVYEKQGNTTKALYNYQQADDWAAKANYSITNFNYSAIPHNIAVLLSNDLKFEESLKYCDKALAAIDNETGRYTDKLYALESKAANYAQLKNADSALAYYEKAQEIADKHNDKPSKDRIIISMIATIANIKDDYGKAEKECRQLLSTISPNDSILTGRTYMALSGIYLKTERLDSSLYFIYKAKQLLVNADMYYKIPLYQRLYTVERANGNTTAANEYEKQYKQLKDVQLKSKQAQLSEIKSEAAQIEAQLIQDKLLALESAWTVSQKQASENNALMYAVFACLALIIIFILRERKIRVDGYEQFSRLKFEKETQMRNILQHNDLISLHTWVEDNYDPSELSKRLLKKIERMIPDAHWELKPKLYAVNYRTMLYNFQVDFPYLDELEHGLICLVCTGLYDEKERAEILEISPEHYLRIEKSVQYKFSERGCKFGDVINESRTEYNIEPIDDTEYLSPRRYIIWWRKFVRVFKSVKD